MSVRIEYDGPVTTVVIDRPEARNAVDGPTAAALADAFRAFDADPDAAGRGAARRRRHVLRGRRPQGDRYAGRQPGPTGRRRTRTARWAPPGCGWASRSSPPIEGHAVAGGLELALWCDLRVAAEDATFGVFCRRWGVPLIDGGTVRLPRLIGTGAGPGPDPHRPGGRRRRGATPWGWSTGSSRRVRPARPPRRWPTSWPRCRRTCLRNDRLSVLEQEGLPEEEALRGRARARRCGRSVPTPSRVPRGSPAAPGRHGA